MGRELDPEKGIKRVASEQAVAADEARLEWSLAAELHVSRAPASARMMDFDAVENEFVAALSSHDVRFVVIGGHAVTHYGVERPVKDLDVVIDHIAPNPDRVVKALATLGEGGFTAAQLSQPLKQLRLPRRSCELLTSVSIPFEELFSAAEAIEVGGRVVKVVSREHLKRLKREAGRPSDLADVTALEENGNAG